MYRATTAEHTFTMPEDTSVYDIIQITYKQRAKKLVKTLIEGREASGIMAVGDTVLVTLTQEETRRFSVGKATVQVRVLRSDGKAYASEEFIIDVKGVNNEDILQ